MSSRVVKINGRCTLYFLVLLFSILPVTNAFARVIPYFIVGYNLGAGDSEWVDGQVIEVIGGTNFGLGFDTVFQNSRFYLSTTLGYQYNQEDTYFSEQTYVVIPADVILRYRFQFGIGGVGLVNHFNPKFETCWFSECKTIRPGTQKGYVFSYGYVINSLFRLDLKYIFMNYDVNCDCEMDANSIGMYMSYRF